MENYSVCQLQERFGVGGHGCRPHDPVGFGVGFPAVEGQSELILLFQIVVYLFPHHLIGEKVSAPQFVPHKVVLDAPCARTVKGQPVVVAVFCIRLPLFCHLPGFLDIGPPDLLAGT